MFSTPRILLIATAILEGIGGLMAIIAPPMFLMTSFPGVEGGPAALLVARAFGISLVAFAVLAILARNLTGDAVKPVLAALLTYNVLIAVHFGAAFVAHQGAITAPIFHLILSVGYGYYWHKSR